MFSKIKKIQEEQGINVYIFCAGNKGRDLLNDIRIHRIDVSAFIDNDKDKQGTRVEGIQVISLDKAERNGICVIANATCCDEIRSQAEQYFLKDRIVDLEKVYMRYHDGYDSLVIPEHAMPIVSVVLTVFNGWDYTYNCIESFLETKTEVPYDFIIGDNKSTDQTAEIEKVVKGARIVHRKENIGYLKNVNKSASEAKAKYMLLLQNDTFFIEDYWLDDLVGYMENNEECAAVSLDMRAYDGKMYLPGNARVNENGDLVGYAESFSDEPYSVSYIQPAAVVFRKSVWDEMNGYDEIYHPAWCEDVDLYLRILKAGYDIVLCPFKSFIHYGSKTCGQPPEAIFSEHYRILRERFGGEFITLQRKTDERNKLRGIVNV